MPQGASRRKCVASSFAAVTDRAGSVGGTMTAAAAGAAVSTPARKSQRPDMPPQKIMSPSTQALRAPQRFRRSTGQVRPLQRRPEPRARGAYGTVDEVHRATRELIDVMTGDRGGYILAASHTVPPETPMDNIFAMYHEAGVTREAAFDRARQLAAHFTRAGGTYVTVQDTGGDFAIGRHQFNAGKLSGRS